MKKIILAGLALFSLFAGYSQTDENLQTRNVAGFQSIEISGGIDLYLSSGPESVAVSASSTSIRDHIITEVVNGTLRIHMEKNWFHDFGNTKRKAYVSIHQIKKSGCIRRQ